MSDGVTWRLTEPRRGWARWTWSVPAPHLRPTLPLDLAEVPGVKVAEISPTEGFVEAHESACQVDSVFAFAKATGILGFPWTIRCSTFVPASADEAFARFDAVATRYGLFAHQAQAGAAALGATMGLLLGDEMGLGKTRAAAISVHERVQAADKILVVAPKYLRPTWFNELLALGLVHAPEDFCALETLDNGHHDDVMRRARFWFCHWDILDAWASRIRVNLTGKKPAAVIFDEAHHARNIKTKRGRAMQLVAGSTPFRMVLTGTPHVTRPSDLYALLTAVGGPGSWGSLFEFRRRYCGAFQDDYGYRDGEPTNVEEFRARLEGRYLARTKAQVGLQLPPLLRRVVEIDGGSRLDDEMRGFLKHYRVSMAQIVHAIRNGSGGEDVFRAMHALRKHTSSLKRSTTLELLADIVEGGQSALVFVQERAMAEELTASLNRRLPIPLNVEVSFLHGGVNDDERERLLGDFQAALVDKRPRVLIATYGALREGVTLTAASHVVFHDLDWTPAVVFQAEARAHRMGLRHSVTSHWLACASSIDTLFAEALLRKTHEQRELLAASAGAEALEDLGLVETSGAPSVADDAQRLLSSWGGASWS